MYPAIGNQWNMLYSLTSIKWDPPRALDASCSAAVLQGLEYEVGQLNPAQAPVPGDFYYWGGTLAAQARLALIAYLTHPRLAKGGEFANAWILCTATISAARIL
jgi:endo-1,3(4)-beta-glucanase